VRSGFRCEKKPRASCINRLVCNLIQKLKEGGFVNKKQKFIVGVIAFCSYPFLHLAFPSIIGFFLSIGALEPWKCVVRK